MSSVANGQGRQASALYYDGYYYMVVPTTTESGNYHLGMTTHSDLLLVKLDKDWKIIESKNISRDHDNIETFVLGFGIHNGLFFVTYKQGYKVENRLAFVCPLKVYDQKLNLISSNVVKKAAGRRESLRSSLEVTDDRIYVGLSSGQGPPPPGMNQYMRQTRGDLSQRPDFQAGQNSLLPKASRRIRKGGGVLPPQHGFSKDKSTIGNIGRAIAEIYIYEINW